MKYRFYRNINSPPEKAIFSLTLPQGNLPYYYRVAIHEPVELGLYTDELDLPMMLNSKEQLFKLTVRHNTVKDVNGVEIMKVEETCYVMESPIKRVK